MIVKKERYDAGRRSPCLEPSQETSSGLCTGDDPFPGNLDCFGGQVNA
jgi:hypothetical protein